MPLLKTFVHVSDLHFAGPLQRYLYDPIAHQVPLFDGLVGHDAGVLPYLQNTYDDLKSKEPDVELIVTGDLTAQGIGTEFDDAVAFLGSKSSSFPFLGLGAANWLRYAIPGNHDHWPGRLFNILGGPNARVRAEFPAKASITPSKVLPDGRVLVFLLLNGDADVGAYSLDRLFAQGSFVSAVNELRALLAARKAVDEARVLLLHYSAEYPGWGPLYVPSRSDFVRPLGIDTSSRKALAALIADEDIKVVLTGHTHEPFFVGDLAAVLGSPAGAVMEARCGTTTQRLKSKLNLLFVHRIENDDSGRIWWKSELYARMAGGTANFASTGPSFDGLPAIYAQRL